MCDVRNGNILYNSMDLFSLNNKKTPTCKRNMKRKLFLKVYVDNLALLSAVFIL